MLYFDPYEENSNKGDCITLLSYDGKSFRNKKIGLKNVPKPAAIGDFTGDKKADVIFEELDINNTANLILVSSHGLEEDDRWSYRNNGYAVKGWPISRQIIIANINASNDKNKFDEILSLSGDGNEIKFLDVFDMNCEDTDNDSQCNLIDPCPNDVSNTCRLNLLYNHDLTNIASTKSEEKFAGIPDFNDDLREAIFRRLKVTIEEGVLNGADAISFSPGMGWVPYWQSKIVPPVEHLTWYINQFTNENEIIPDKWLKYLTCFGVPNSSCEKGDLIEDYLSIMEELKEELKIKHEVISLISFRLVDHHHLESLNNGQIQGPGAAYAQGSISKFYFDLSEIIKIDQILNFPYDWKNHLLNLDWGKNWQNDEALRNLIPEPWRSKYSKPQDYKLDLIREIASYPVDGIELDFMRWPSYFSDLSDDTKKDRENIMTDFVREVRWILDENSPTGKRKILVIRIPFQTDAHSM